MTIILSLCTLLLCICIAVLLFEKERRRWQQYTAKDLVSAQLQGEERAYLHLFGTINSCQSSYPNNSGLRELKELTEKEISRVKRLKDPSVF